ncbi:hypothetical protein, partial [Plasmodium yoelii yoelii]
DGTYIKLMFKLYKIKYNIMLSPNPIWVPQTPP